MKGRTYSSGPPPHLPHSPHPRLTDPEMFRHDRHRILGAKIRQQPRPQVVRVCLYCWLPVSRLTLPNPKLPRYNRSRTVLMLPGFRSISVGDRNPVRNPDRSSFQQKSVPPNSAKQRSDRENNKKIHDDQCGTSKPIDNDCPHRVSPVRTGRGTRSMPHVAYLRSSQLSRPR